MTDHICFEFKIAQAVLSKVIYLSPPPALQALRSASEAREAIHWAPQLKIQDSNEPAPYLVNNSKALWLEELFPGLSSLSTDLHCWFFVLYGALIMQLFLYRIHRPLAISATIAYHRLLLGQSSLFDLVNHNILQDVSDTKLLCQLNVGYANNSYIILHTKNTMKYNYRQQQHRRKKTVRTFTYRSVTPFELNWRPQKSIN